MQTGETFFCVHDYLIDCSLGECADSDRPLSISGQTVGNVLFEHEWKLVPPKPKALTPARRG